MSYLKNEDMVGGVVVPELHSISVSVWQALTAMAESKHHELAHWAKPI
ncbi:unnamed protein product [Acidithrix sp. C25]|nr:unnamed protein product [Acidithrix sp. C25]